MSNETVTQISNIKMLRRCLQEVATPGNQVSFSKKILQKQINE